MGWWAIQTHRLTRAFGSKTAVDAVDVEVEAGSIYGLIGPNGAGKSTLVALLCTLVTPTSGTALVAGYDVRSQSNQVRRSIALNFGGERSFYYRLRMQANLEFFAALYGFDRRETAQRVQAALERTGLWQERRTYYSDGSAGMKKRLNFARSLLLDAPIHICDEPTTGVDVDSGLRLREILRELRAAGRTVLLVSHNMDEVAALADRVGLMHRGRIVHSDTPDGFRRLIAPHEVRVDLVEPVPTDLLADLRALPCVAGVNHGALQIRLEAADPERVMPDVIAVLHRRSAQVSAVQVVRPDLAEVFRHLVGGD